MWTVRITTESQKRARPINVCIDRRKEKRGRKRYSQSERKSYGRIAKGPLRCEREGKGESVSERKEYEEELIILELSHVFTEV